MGPDAEPLGDSRAETFYQDVGPFDQVQHHTCALRVLQIDDHRAFSAIHDVGRSAGIRLAHPLRTVHSHDLGAQVGQQHAGERAGPDTAEFDDPAA